MQFEPRRDLPLDARTPSSPLESMPLQNIKHCLQRFQAAMKDGNGMELSAALAELDGLVATHRQELHPQLLHYLEGRSYAKALAWLGLDSSYARPSSPPEGCGGGNKT